MMEKNIKVVILCGGKGSRLAEETKITPKPMIKIGNLPILIHIMKKYYKHGFKNFVLALGYKKEIIIDYFKIEVVKDQLVDWQNIFLRQVFQELEVLT